jgi:hypothetical protein
MEPHELRRITALLDQIAGRNQGRRLVDRLIETRDAPGSIAREVARSPSFERLYKEARTTAVAPRAHTAADAALVGIPALDQDRPFAEQFHGHFQPRLGKRADGFAAIFEALTAGPPRPLIIETGCLRIPGNWEGDGQSTFMFDALVRAQGGAFFSIDILAESIETARRACSSAVNLICNDSVAALYTLSQLLRGPAALVYLDSYDVDVDNPIPSAIHHALELAAVRPLLGPGTLVCVDDYGIGPQPGGKGLILDQFFTTIRATVLYSGYQRIWLVP